MERVYLESVDSTNKWAKENVDSLNNLTVVYTSNQTAGRGRLQRKWCDVGEDNIYASIVLKPNTPMKQVYSNLTQYLCVILSEVFEEYGVKTEIKWPNDLKVNSQKISGILAEAVTDKNGNVALILGFGVNLNCKESDIGSIDQPATALNLIVGRHVDKDVFFNRVLDKFCLRYDSFIREGFGSIRERYVSGAGFLNKNISVKVFDKTYQGLALDVTSDGALKLKDEFNNEHILMIGDIL